VKTKTSFEVGGKTISLESGRLAGQADGAVLVECGEVSLLITAVASAAPRAGMDFFPLTIDIEEKMYAAGKIPGSFFRREGRPSEKGILMCRLIDRPIRPMFPDGFRNDVHVIGTMLSVDMVNQPDVLMLMGASAALSISDIPFDGPIGGVRIGRVDGQFIVNPTYAEQANSDLDLVMAGKDGSVTMVESGADEVSEEDILAAFEVGVKAIDEMVAGQKMFRDELFAAMDAAGKTRKQREFPIATSDPELVDAVNSRLGDRVNQAVRIAGKDERNTALKELRTEVKEALADTYAGREDDVAKALKNAEKKAMRSMVLNEGVRVDGRGLTDIRPIGDGDHPVEVKVLPRAHGSGLFTRGETQILSVLALGSTRQEQRMDGLDPEDIKRYIHHYNFPPFSTGETGRMVGPKRREIGHGALAERALLPVIPSVDDFPYTIRIVSEALSSNGSTSMGSVCGSTLALMDAGVPIKAPVAGIAMGLIAEGEGDNQKVAVLSDILGMEDALGDMDFKVAGTTKGVTALQMDMKATGMPLHVLGQAMTQAKAGRAHILQKLLDVLAEPREEMSPYAPRVMTTKVDTDKIGMVIGPSGKTIRAIQEETDSQVSIEDDGTILIHAKDQTSGEQAKAMIDSIVREPEIGEVYLGKVVRCMPFGAFVQILPGKDGLVHISKLGEGHVNRVEDVVKEGDSVVVEIAEIDRQGRINLVVNELNPQVDESTVHGLVSSPQG